jgi:hypothetical protein
MMADGLEVENFPLHKLFHDYVRGQAYAMEFVFALLQDRALNDDHLMTVWHPDMLSLMASEMTNVLQHKNVYAMVGFAVKQTMDYVQRGERKTRAEAVLQKLNSWHSILSTDGAVPRLDTMVCYQKGETLVNHRLIDELSVSLGIPRGESINQNKKMDTLELNGRAYLETTRVDHLIGAIQKLVDSYGARSSEAATKDVDWKSMSHAVRVYQQVEEFLDTGFITFPRPNTEELIAIKEGRVPLDVVREQLRELDARIQPRCEPANNEELKKLDAKADDLLLAWLKDALEL